jgi:hypothetical protein
MRWAAHVERMGEGRVGLRGMVGKTVGKRPLGRPRPRWEDLHEVGCGVMDWSELAHHTDKWRALMYVVMNLRVP